MTAEHEPPYESLSPEQQSRLSRFEHLTRQIANFEPRVNAGEPLAWGTANEKGQVVDTHVVIDKPQIERMKRMAFGMYESDLQHDPKTRDVAEDIIATYTAFPEEEGSEQYEYQPSELWFTNPREKREDA